MRIQNQLFKFRHFYKVGFQMVVPFKNNKIVTVLNGKISQDHFIQLIPTSCLLLAIRLCSDRQNTSSYQRTKTPTRVSIHIKLPRLDNTELGHMSGFQIKFKIRTMRQSTHFDHLKTRHVRFRIPTVIK